VPLIFPLLAFLLFVVILLQKGIEVSGVPRAAEVQLTQEGVQASFLARMRPGVFEKTIEVTKKMVPRVLDR
jgi:hypothetical protein